MLNFSGIESWLKEHSIKNYIISDDLSVTVQGNVNLHGKLKEQKLPVKFKSIDGYFDISDNNLISLEGCPKTVTKDFNCSKNKLVSLFDAPIDVGEFDCSHNLLKNLSYCPKEVRGNFNCSFNEITSIKGSPRSIKGYFKCNDNRIASLKGAPQHIDMYFDCSHNHLETLVGGPVSVGQDYICQGNNLTDLDGLADEIGWDLQTNVRLNHLNSSYNEEGEYFKYKGAQVIAHIYKPIVALNNAEDIKKWLNRHEIKNFRILSDNSVDVMGDVRLCDKLNNMLKLPLNFNTVEGDFDISDNELTSLEGCPKKVSGSFLAYKNELTSLKGGPKEVGGNFIVLHNNITSLQNSPTIVKEDFICSHNPLRDLEGINTVIGYVFTCVYVPKLKCQKFNYKGVITYKYSGDAVTKYLDQEYVSLTDEERAFEITKKNLEKAIKKMLNSGSLTKDMITDTLIRNLEKYHLEQLKAKILLIKNPPNEEDSSILTEEEIIKLVFDKEL